jgi:hypothetical protein
MLKLPALAAISFLVILGSCSSKTNALPEAPVSIKAVQDELKGKKYSAENAGTHSVFKDDKEIQWLKPDEKNSVEKSVADESKSIQMEFADDTSVVVSGKGKINKGTYKVNDEVGEDEKPGIKLRISYVDEEFKMGDGPAMMVTYTYTVEGINSKSLLLETPRSLNNHKIVVLMKKI